MPVNCNDVKNPLVSRLLDGIDDWASREDTIENVKMPYEAAISMFEARFNIPIEGAALLGAKKSRDFLGVGAIEAFKSDLNKYVNNVKSGKLTSFEVLEGFMTGTVLGKKDPVLAETLKEIRNIVSSHQLREANLSKEFVSIIDKIKASAGLSERKLKKGLSEHRKLYLNYIKALDSNNQNDIDEANIKLKEFEKGGVVNTFVDFVKIVENTVPEAIALKLEDEKTLADSGDKQAIKRVADYESGQLVTFKDDNETREYLERVGVDDSLIPAVRDYNKLMNNAYRTLRLGIEKKIETIINKIENKKGSKSTVEKLEELEENLKSKLMPRYEEGYFPHYTNELNINFMDNLMPYFDKMETSQIDGKHDSLDIDDIIENLNDAIPSFGKTRTQGTNYEYNRNFVDVVSSYIQQINKFNTNAFLTNSHFKSLDLARGMYGETQYSDYSAKIVSTIESIYGSMNGSSKLNSSMNEIRQALLSYQFFNKLGFSLRSGLKNYTQILLNVPTFGISGMYQSYKYLKQNELRLNIDKFLKDSNLYMDTSEAAIESGLKGKGKDVVRIRKMNEDGKIIYGDEGSFVYKGVKIFASGMGKLAQKSSYFHRTVENTNRKITAKIAYGQINKLMDESPRFEKYIQKQIDSGAEKGSISDIKNRYAKSYTKNMVILNHFDYESYAKARNMREGIGQFLFQFQHYGMEFLERNYAIVKESYYDGKVLKKEKTKFSEWLKDAKGVHKSMNMVMAYFMAPALISYISGYNQTLVEHTGKEILEDIYLLLFSDLDDEEQRERVNRNFYGKGVVISKLGPTVGTIIDVGVMTELINADSEYLDNLAFSVGDYSDNDNMDTFLQQVKLFNQFAGRAVDRYIPMGTKNPYGSFSAIPLEFTVYPKKKDEATLYRDIEPVIKKIAPDYYFEKLEEKSKSRKKYGKLPVGLRNSLLYMEKEGKRR